MFGFSSEGVALAKQVYGAVQSRMAMTTKPDVSLSLMLLRYRYYCVLLDSHYSPYLSMTYAHETTMIILSLVTCSFSAMNLK